MAISTRLRASSLRMRAARWALTVLMLMCRSSAISLFVQPWAGGGLILLVFIAELPALLRSQTLVAEHNLRLGERILRELGHG